MALGLLPCLAAYAIKLHQKTKQETATKITSATATCVSNVRGTMRYQDFVRSDAHFI